MHAQDDPRTNGELLHCTLTDEDEDRAWEAIAVLHLRGSPDTFEAARQLCASADANERRVGADILGQLGLLEATFQEASVTTLLGMLESEHDPRALHSIAVALGHRRDPRAIEPLARLKNHPDPQVRAGVTHGLMVHEDALAIATLIELSADPESLVRDWATFSIGSMIETDTPTVRAALMARTADADPDARGEAVMGLARRRDPRVIEILLALFAPDRFWDDLAISEYACGLELAAAEELAEPRLLPVLERLRQEWQQENKAEAEEDSLSDLLEAVIKACQRGQED